jgi:hypothetical protein
MVQASTTEKGIDAIVKHTTFSVEARCVVDGCEWAHRASTNASGKHGQKIKDRCFEHLLRVHAIPLSDAVVRFERVSEKVAR